MRRTLISACIILVQISSAAVAADPLSLSDLNRRQKELEKLADEARAKAKTPAEEKEIFETLDPRNALCDDLLKVERGHRGDADAIGALYQLTLHAVSVGDPESKASRGRVQAIEIARQHYLGHTDLDLLLNHFEGGVFVPEAEALLRDAMKSPHEHVRAAARYRLARFLAREAKLAKMFKKPLHLPPDTPAEIVARVNKQRDAFNERNIDPIPAEQEAIRLAAELLADYPQIEQSVAIQENDNDLAIRRKTSESLGLKRITYAESAASLRFEIEHLQEGQLAPDIIGVDVDDKQFKLSDYRGRVVLLIFSANWCGPCKAMYPELRKLLEELNSEPFAILAVMGDAQHETVKNDTKSGEIRWRTWFDGTQGPIATQWNNKAWPTVVVVDHKGIIVAHEPGRTADVLKKQIGPLLEAQKSDPAAHDLIKANPLPELPPLKEAD